MARVLILGGGGHAQVVADALLRAHEAGAVDEPIGFVDDNPALAGQTLLGLPVLGSVADIPRIAHDLLVVAIGSNAVRRRLYETLAQQGEQFAIVRHPSAIIAPDVRIGSGTMVSAGVVVNTGSVIGQNVILNTACTVDHHNQIGDHTHIAPGVHLGGDVVVGPETLIGIGATVMPQRHIGTGCAVGAGSLVNKHIADYRVAVGLPARVVKSLRES